MATGYTRKDRKAPKDKFSCAGCKATFPTMSHGKTHVIQSGAPHAVRPIK